MQTEQTNGSQVTPETDPFLKTLIGLIRAEDSYGAWDKKTDVMLLAPFVVTKEERRAIPIIGDPDPDVIHRVEQYYRAVGLRIEQRTSLMATPTVTINHEGFGRVFLTTGKLVAFSKTLRDVHRFSFDSLADLSAEGEKAVEKAIKTMEEYPQVARA
jgi:probable nitrogen fixation protein